MTVTAGICARGATDQDALLNLQMRNPGMLLDVHVSEGATFSTPVRSHS